MDDPDINRTIRDLEKDEISVSEKLKLLLEKGA